MASLLDLYVPRRDLRSAGRHLLEVPQARLEKYGGRSFSSAAPALWNKLPETIKTADSVEVFKKRLKTNLFRQAFPNNL